MADGYYNSKYSNFMGNSIADDNTLQNFKFGGSTKSCEPLPRPLVDDNHAVSATRRTLHHAYGI